MVRLAWLMTFVSLVMVGVCGTAAAQQWYEHRPPGAGYRVEFPGEPKLDTKDVKAGAATVTMVMAVVERATDAFMSIHSIFPPETVNADPQRVLDGARDGGVRNVQGQLREERRLTVDGAPARYLVIDIPQAKGVGLALVVLSGNMVYQALYIGPAGTENAAEVERFIQSLRLVSR